MTFDVFAPRALRELEHAAARIAEDNPDAAEAFLQATLAAARRVAARPNLGSSRPPISPRYKFWSLTRYSYLLVYDPNSTPVQILRVVHTKRDLPRVLADLPV